MKRFLTIGATAMLALAAVACTGAAADGPGDTTNTPSPGIAVGEPAPGTGTPITPPRDHMEMQTVTAPVLEAEVLPLDSRPEFVLRALVEIGDGCNSFDSAQVERDGDVINVTLLRSVPAHPEVVSCIAIYQTHEEVVPLGTDLEAGHEYTVNVNDGEQTLTFTP